MDPLVIASPHFDDAVLSCGQLMAGRPDCVITTVFALAPAVSVSTDFDRRSGFAGSDDAVLLRMGEDEAAARLLRATTRRLPFIDNQYREGEPADVEVIVDALLVAVQEANGSQLVAPLGLAHPDHVAVGDAALRIAVETSIEVVLYEDLPSRVLWPEQVCERLDEVRGVHGVELALSFIGTGSLAVKERAVSCYRSQAWALDRRCLFVPERYWSVIR